MSEENVEIVRSICAPWEHGDYSSGEWAHPDIELVRADGPSPGSWKGLAGMAEGWRDFLSAWVEHRTEVEQLRQLDDERVLVLTHSTGRGRTSGMEISERWTKAACVFHVRSARVAKLVVYVDRKRAFADLGLDPEGESPRS